jgi:regulator of sirC expression with transglutaminase-like and TPR domain
MAGQHTDGGPGKATLRQRLADLARRTHEETDLGAAALLIAAEENPDADIAASLAELDRLAGLARGRLRERAGESPHDHAFALTALLYQDEGFQGNTTEYYDARNSDLNEVLRRRLGIPITLAVVYMEVARRAGIATRGVGFPGHFLVKHVGPPEVVVDPFTGAVLTEEDCRNRLETTLGPGTHSLASYLAAATPLDIVVRMLRNLKRIHLEAEAPLKALAASERILMLLPDQPEELRDRGLAYERLECFPEAVSDLERSLELAPDQPQAELLRKHVADLMQRAGRIN